MIRTKVRKAFTLVEILIVVVILGILAAIVVPQFTNATQDAQAGNVKAQISSLQRQIELYMARNNNQTPFTALDWTALINGNYIKAAPRNPACPGANSVKEAIGTTAAATCGWVWDAATTTLSATYFDESTGLITPTTP